MNTEKKIPEFGSYEEMSDFCETHDVTDYWDQTEAAEFDISPDARRRDFVPVDRDLLIRVQQIAHRRGITTAPRLNVLLEQR